MDSSGTATRCGPLSETPASSSRSPRIGSTSTPVLAFSSDSQPGSEQSSPRVAQLPFLDSGFTSDTLGNGPDALDAPGQARPGGPFPYVIRVDGEPKGVAGLVQAQTAIPGSEIDGSEARTTFKSIKTINDDGYGEWEPPSDAASPTPSVMDENVSQVAGRPCSASFVSGQPTHALPGLEGIGDSFPSLQSEPGPTRKQFFQALDVDTVADQIHRAWEHSAFSEGRFLPLNKLCSIVNQASVRLLLSNVCTKSEELDSRVRQICGPDVPSTGRRRIFALLILVGKIESIPAFIDAGLNDLHLPLKFEWNKDNRRYNVSKEGNQFLANPLSCFHILGTTAVESFEHNQSRMLAPFFHLPDNQVFYYKIARHTVLPLIGFERKVDGGYGSVWKVKIHKAHHSFGGSQNLKNHNPYFALKEIRSYNPEEFRKEVEVLEKFCGANKPYKHLIRLLLAFRHGERHYLLFPWADGNLKELWSRWPNPEIRSARWLVWQCLGLATGLSKIHKAATTPKKGTLEVDQSAQNFGRHGDMKPENILWFTDDKEHIQLVISDFGLSRYHSRKSVSTEPHSKVHGFSLTYRPPELDLKTNINQRYDIWSLGCIFLEFISWLILGGASNDDFSRARLEYDNPLALPISEDKFFNVVGGGQRNGQPHAEVKSSVKEWMRKLHAHPSCPDVVHDFMDMIEKRLLVPSSKDRWQCSQIRTELKAILEKNENSAEYWEMGRPRHAGSNPEADASQKSLLTSSTAVDKARHLFLASDPAADLHHGDESHPPAAAGENWGGRTSMDNPEYISIISKHDDGTELHKVADDESDDNHGDGSENVDSSAAEKSHRRVVSLGTVPGIAPGNTDFVSLETLEGELSSKNTYDASLATLSNSITPLNWKISNEYLDKPEEHRRSGIDGDGKALGNLPKPLDTTSNKPRLLTGLQSPVEGAVSQPPHSYSGIATRTINKPSPSNTKRQDFNQLHQRASLHRSSGSHGSGSQRFDSSRAAEGASDAEEVINHVVTDVEPKISSPGPELIAGSEAEEMSPLKRCWAKLRDHVLCC